MNKQILLNLIMLLVNVDVAFRVEGNKVRCWMPVDTETTPIVPPVQIDNVHMDSYVAVNAQLDMIQICYQWTIPDTAPATAQIPAPETKLPIVEC